MSSRGCDGLVRNLKGRFSHDMAHIEKTGFLVKRLILSRKQASRDGFTFPIMIFLTSNFYVKLYSCIDIYAYSCLKLLSNRPKAILNPCSNHEIRMPFEHGFQLKMRFTGRTLFQRCYLILRRFPFQTFVKKNVNANVMLVFAQITSHFTRIKMANVKEFVAIFCELFTFLCYFWLYFTMESLRKCKNNNHTCLFQCINISHVSRKQFEPSAWWSRVQTTSSSHGKC